MCGCQEGVCVRLHIRRARCDELEGKGARSAKVACMTRRLVPVCGLQGCKLSVLEQCIVSAVWTGGGKTGNVERLGMDCVFVQWCTPTNSGGLAIR